MAHDKHPKKLSTQQAKVLRGKETEPPFSGRLLHNKQDGGYYCAACGQLLFDSQTKFDSGSGWPSFNFPVNKKALNLTADNSAGQPRVEVSCAECGSHLGHVFNDAPSQPTGLRFCINSVALDFKKRSKS